MHKQQKYEAFNEIIRYNMRKQLEELGYPDFDKADQRSKGLAFLRFYLHEIFSQFIDIDDDGIESGIVDKANDLGIDFIHTIEDKIYIIQSKYQSKYTTQKIGKEQLEHFIQIPNLIYQKEYTNKGHEELKLILNDITKIKKPSFQLTFITNSKISDDDISFYENRNVKMNVVYSIMGASQLRQEYNRVESMNYLPPDEVVFDLGNEDYVNLRELTDDYPIILITQKGSKLKQIYDRLKESLFNYNIRFWLGKNAVNNGMIETIKNEPERFFYYNNGVTAVCEEYVPDFEQNKLTCKKLQIINGAQTVTTIAKQKSNLSNVKVLLKIIKSESGINTESQTGLNENIVRYSNSQTIINVSDFRSNDNVQVSLERQADKLKFTLVSHFKDIFYKRKRRKEIPKKNTKVITMQDLGKSYYSFKFNPHELNANIKLLWDTSSKGLYYTVFGFNDDKIDSMPQDKIIEMFGIYYIFEYIKCFLKGRLKDDTPAVLFKYHVLWVINQILSLKYSEKQILEILEFIVENGCYINKNMDEKKEKDFSSYVDKSIRIVNGLIIKEKKRKDSTFVIRNYQRNKDFTDDLKSSINTFISPSDLAELI